MTTGHVFMAMSLDGFVARPDHGIDWLMKQPDTDGDAAFREFFGSVDGMIMGAGTFRTVLGFDQWIYGDKPIRVMSRSLTREDVPEGRRKTVEVTRQDPKALMEMVEIEGWKRAYVDGGAVVHSFLRAGLISDLTITIIPILLGEGLSLFGPLERDIDLKLEHAEKTEAGFLSTRYRVV